MKLLMRFVSKALNTVVGLRKMAVSKTMGRCSPPLCFSRQSRILQDTRRCTIFQCYSSKERSVKRLSSGGLV